MNKLFSLVLTLLLCIGTLTVIAQVVREPMTFESYNNMHQIFKGYPIAVTKADSQTFKITYQVVKMFKGDESIKQVTALSTIDPNYHDYRDEQIGEAYTQLFFSRYGIGTEQLGGGRLFIGCEGGNDLECLENYTPRCDRYEQAKFILDNGHETGYVKNYYYKFNGYKEMVFQWLPLGLEAEGYLKDGRAHGLWKYYEKDGKLKREVIYQEGIRIGSVALSENGISLSFGTQKLQYAYSFDNDNNLVRYSKTEYKSDNDSVNFPGYLDTESIEYYSNGMIKIWYTDKWVDNKYTVDKKEYYENGNLKEEGQIWAGEKIGIWHYYDENGNLINTQDHSKK